MFDIRETVESLNEANFSELKKNTSSIIKCRFIDADLMDKDQYCEKVMDYIDAIKSIHNIQHGNLINTAVEDLLSLLKPADKKTGKRTNSYIAKAKELAKQIKTNTNDIDMLMSFARIFLCVFTAQLAVKKTVSDDAFSFDLERINISKVLEFLLNQKVSRMFKGDSELKVRFSKRSFEILVLCIIYAKMINDSPEAE